MFVLQTPFNVMSFFCLKKPNMSFLHVSEREKILSQIGNFLSDY